MAHRLLMAVLEFFVGVFEDLGAGFLHKHRLITISRSEDDKAIK